MVTSTIKKLSDINSCIKNLANLKQEEKYIIVGHDFGDITTLMHEDRVTNISIDKYCYECKKEKTLIFNVLESYNLIQVSQKFASGFGMPTIVYFSKPEEPKYSRIKDIFTLTFSCPECDEKIYMYYLVNGEEVTKIFEYPSPIKSMNREYKEYNMLDSKFNYYKELSTANYLYYDSHAYIGAFVYIRRCLEHYILNMVNEKVKDGELSEDDVRGAKKFENYVELLKPFIIKEVYETIYPTYSIMSKGVHELSEEDCQRMFDLLKITVINLLEERLHEIKKEKRLRQHRNRILNLNEEQSAKS